MPLTIPVILAWVHAHPTFAFLIVWPVLTAIASLIFHPRSAAELAGKSPRATAFWALVASVGCDVPKAIDGLRLAVDGETPGDRATGVARAVAAVVIDVPKALSALRQLITGTPPAGPNVLTALAFVGVGLLAFVLQACALFTPKNIETVLDVIQVGCIIEHAFVDDATLNALCDLRTPAQREAGRLIATKEREAVGRRMASMRSEACSDAGTDAR